MSRGWRLVWAQRGSPQSASARRFALRARRRRARAAAPWLLALGAGVVLALVAFLIGNTGLVGVDQVRVTGTAIADPAEVRTAAHIGLGSPMIRIDLGEVARRVRKVPAVRTVQVTRDWPATVVIHVVERTAIAAVPTSSGGYVGVDQAGVAFQPLSQVPAGMAVVKITNPASGDPTTRAALTVLESLPQELRQLMSALVAEAPARIRLELTDGRTIVWGDSAENSTKARVALLLLTKPGKVLDVSAPNLVTVR